MTPEVLWLAGLLSGLALGVPTGILLATTGIPRLVDAMYGWVRRDRGH